MLDAEGDLVLSLTDGVVDRDDLLQLASSVLDANDKTEEFFRALEEQPAV